MQNFFGDRFEDGEIEGVFEDIINRMWGDNHNERELGRMPKEKTIIERIKRKNEKQERDRMFGDNNIKGVGNTLAGAGLINIIPADKNSKGECVSIVVVFCSSKNKLDERLRQLVNHFGIYCRKKTSKALIITNQWNNDIWIDHSPEFRQLEQDLQIRIYKAQLEGHRFIKTQLV